MGGTEMPKLPRTAPGALRLVERLRAARGPDKARAWFYPDEDAMRLGSPAVPLDWRVFYGFLTREGPRSAESPRSRTVWASAAIVRS